MKTENQTAAAEFRWKLTNGKFVHPECREDYQANKTKGGNRPAIESAVYEGFQMSRFELCAHCNIPIWEKAP